MIVLGIHGGVTVGQHEPGASVIINGRVIAVCEEERYLRIKSCYGLLPVNAIEKCLEISGISINDVDLVVAPGITYKDQHERISDFLRHYFGHVPQLEIIHHQVAHLATAFYGSGLEEALCLSLDAAGDEASGAIAYATRKNGIKVIEYIPTNNSLGYFYTLMTYFLGFVDGDEYKVMGLAPYGTPNIDLSEIISPISDGGWKFNWSSVRGTPKVMSPFEPLYSTKIASIIGQKNRVPNEPVVQFHQDLASSTQAGIEECLISVAELLKSKKPECKNLVYAGGVSLNCKANRKLIYSNLFENVYVPPVPSDRGLSLGCAYWGSQQLGDSPWPILSAYLGSSYSENIIREELISNAIPFVELENANSTAADSLANGKIIGWFQGRSEAGARALGNRSILASCLEPGMKDRVNARIKYREKFRPFAPAIKSDKKDLYFRTEGSESPFMSFTFDALDNRPKSIDAVVHVDNTSRVQTVRSSDNEIFYDLLSEYESLTDTPVVMNTSFNLKGQPIVETPRDALMTFFGCGLDELFLGNFQIKKPC